MASIRTRLPNALAATLAALLLVACGGGGDDPPPEGRATIGRAGGVVHGPDGVQLAIPPDALAADATFRIARDAGGAPPLPGGLAVLGAVYAITPHGEAFATSAAVQLPVDAAARGGRDAFLIKAQPGGRWTVLGPAEAGAAAVRQGIGSLSYYAVAVCTNNLPPERLFGEVCPGSSALRLELLDGSGIPIPVSQDQTWGAPLPVRDVRGPTTLTMRVTWTRPPGLNRVDTLDTGSVNGGGLLSRQSGLAYSSEAPRALEVSGSLQRDFTIQVDPARLSGAGHPNGVVRNLWAQASYQWPSVGSWGGADWQFDAFLPIRVFHTGVQPSIVGGPTPASVAVAENTSFTLAAQVQGSNLSFQWRYLGGPADATGTPAEGVNDQPSYASPPAPLAWNGRLYYLRACSSTGSPAVTACVDSPASPLTVTPFTERAVFTLQPVGLGVVEGETADFSAAARGTPTPALLWVLNRSCSGLVCRGQVLSAGAAPAGVLSGAVVDLSVPGRLRLNGVPLSAAGATLTALARQSGQLDVASHTVTLGVSPRPVPASIVQGLATPRSVDEGGSLDFVVAAAGTAPLSHAWRVDGVPASGGTLPAGRCAGATARLPAPGTLRLEGVPLACDGASVVVTVSSAATPANARPSSSALLQVRALPAPPQVLAQPADTRIDEGQRAALTLGYAGSAPVTLTLQRFVGGQWVDLASTSGAACASPCTVQTPVLEGADNGASFRLRVANGVGTPADSLPASVAVTLTRRPVFTTQPQPAAAEALQTGPAGTAVFDFAVAADTGSFSWQWLLNGQPLADGSGVAGNGVLAGASVAGSAGGGRSGTLSVANLPGSANGAQLSVRVTRRLAGQARTATSRVAALTVNTTLPPNALTALQVAAGHENSLVLRPDRTVWGWGALHRTDGRVQIANLAPADQAVRPVRLYPAVLTDVRQVVNWYDSFWALQGVPGSVASRVLHWGSARSGADGRGRDGQGGIAGSFPPSRYNEAAPVEALERVGGAARPVDRVCAIAAASARVLMIRAIDDQDRTTDCQPGSAKTVWLVGSLTGIDADSTGVAQKLPGLPASGGAGYAAPAAVYASAPQGVYGSPYVIALEDGRLFAFGDVRDNSLGAAPPAPDAWVGGPAGPVALRSEWGNPRLVRGGAYFNLMVLRDDGSVAVSGYSSNDALGLGPLADGSVINGPVPVLSDSCSALPCAATLAGVTDLAATQAQVTLALRDGRILAWGAANRPLQGGAATRLSFPRLLPGAGSGYGAISASHTHALAIGPGGAVYAWGAGLRGALGDGSGNSQTAPVLVTVP